MVSVLTLIEALKSFEISFEPFQPTALTEVLKADTEIEFLCEGVLLCESLAKLEIITFEFEHEGEKYYSVSSAGIEKLNQHAPSPSQNMLLTLREKLCEVCSEIGRLRGNASLITPEEEQDIQSYITALHTFNETKDTAQDLIGKLSEIEGVTIKEMNEIMDVSPELLLDS